MRDVCSLCGHLVKRDLAGRVKHNNGRIFSTKCLKCKCRKPTLKPTDANIIQFMFKV